MTSIILHAGVGTLMDNNHASSTTQPYDLSPPWPFPPSLLYPCHLFNIQSWPRESLHPFDVFDTDSVRNENNSRHSIRWILVIKYIKTCSPTCLAIYHLLALYRGYLLSPNRDLLIFLHLSLLWCQSCDVFKKCTNCVNDKLINCFWMTVSCRDEFLVMSY